jgi:hypothetical protein
LKILKSVVQLNRTMPSLPSASRLMEHAGSNRLLIIVIMVLSGLLFEIIWTLKSGAQEQTMSGGNMAAGTKWRPNKKDAKYTGPQACTQCHADEAKHQHATAMGKALEPVATSEILRTYRNLAFRSGPYSYQITRRGDQSLYTVTDGTNTISEPILYSFGQGKAGQTYLFQHNGSFYESRLSFYREIKGLDWTMGYPRDVPPSLDEAAGRAISADEARSCFTCHATAATSGLQLQLDRLIPGVTCESCHGPGAEHIVAMEAKKFEDKQIFNPGHMRPDELTQEFCGSCHRSAEDVISNKLLRGIISVRFQPYRLFTSRGHDPDDARVSCTGCHDPHENPSEDQAFYDSKCFACHRSKASLKSEQLVKAETSEGRSAKPCPVSERQCASCHMPKVELPGSHFRFTDHRIRIVKAGEAFPN